MSGNNYYSFVEVLFVFWNRKLRLASYSVAQNSALFVAKKGKGQIAVFVLCELNELNYFEIQRNLKFWQAWNLPTLYVHMLIKPVIFKTKFQQNDWACELTNLHKSQYFITIATEKLKLFQNCILQSSL